MEVNDNEAADLQDKDNKRKIKICIQVWLMYIIRNDKLFLKEAPLIVIVIAFFKT